MARCPICDYSTDTSQQSSFFNTLPDTERKKKRYERKHPVTGERIVQCTDCFIAPDNEVQRE